MAFMNFIIKKENKRKTSYNNCDNNKMPTPTYCKYYILLIIVNNTRVLLHRYTLYYICLHKDTSYQDVKTNFILFTFFFCYKLCM